MEVSERIKGLRMDVGLNRKDFALQLGIPLRTVEDWEAGRRTPPEYVLRLITYKIRIEVLLRKQKENERNVNIVYDTSGNKVVVIHDIVFRNRQNICWSDVEKYLEQYVGEFYILAEENEKIYIGKDLPDEYSNSKYTRNLQGALAKAKANMAQVIPELIQIANKGIFSSNKNERHDKDAKFGWYRFDSRVAIPVYADNEIERYNVYKVRMIIRYDADGKKYLYDVINIKKEPSNPLG